MDVECPHCGALHWNTEVTALSKPNGRKLFTNCCKNGSISFNNPDAHIPDPPPLLRRLFADNSDEAKTFRGNLRLLNSALSYTSVGCRSDPRLRPEEHQYLFQLQGSIYHMQGPLTTGTDRQPLFSQLYFLDPQQANEARLTNQPQLRMRGLAGLLQRLDGLLRERNPYRHIFLLAKDALEANDGLASLRLTPQLHFVGNTQAGRQYDLPSQDNELSAFVPTLPEEYSGTSYRDVCLYLRNAPSGPEAGVLDELRELDPVGDFSDPQPVPAGPLRERYLTYIHFDHPLYLPLSYVLFYAEGGRGYGQGMQLQGPTARGASFPACLLMVHANPFC
jgi:hypothetical protein